MILRPSNPLYNSVIFYLLSIILIVIIKPEFMYDKKRRKFKQFGTGRRQTILTLPMISIILAIIIYIIFAYIAKTYNLQLKYEEIVKKS